MLLDLYYMVVSFVMMVTLLFIETGIAKATKKRDMKHTVAMCEKAYIRGDIAYTAQDIYTYRDFIYMNEIWSRPKQPLAAGEGARIYWKRENM